MYQELLKHRKAASQEVGRWLLESIPFLS
jgi:hypothetical protein